MKANKGNLNAEHDLRLNKMQFGGLQPFTLTDYPGKTAAILFTIGCNFDCPFCHNKTLLTKAETCIPLDEIFAFLHKRKDQLDGIVISGGEPTIQPNLTEFITEVKNLKYLVKLDTNGYQPNILQNLIQANLLDYIAMDIKAPLEKYQNLTGYPIDTDIITQSINIIYQANIDHQFRTTFVPHLLDENDIIKIKELLPENSLYKIQQYKEIKS